MFAFKLTILLLFSYANANNIVPLISNGIDAEISELPYSISIQEINVHVCGGSLLNENWILSSARCYERRLISNLNIEYGNSIISPGPDGPNKARISQIILHEDYVSSQPRVHDISLVESATPIITGLHEPFSKLIIPGGSRFRSGTVSVHAGWGHISDGVRATRLQKASLNIISFDECLEAVEDGSKPSRLNICALADSVMCTGDLGGGLFVNGVQVGIASFRNGPTCDSVEDKYPNVYTDVSHYIDWIEHHTGIDYQLNMFLQRTA